MTVTHLFLILLLPAYCVGQLTDYMQVYEQQCLGEDKIHCADGSCIWQHQYCDGRVDCADGSDENLCLDRIPEPHLCNETHRYLCGDGKRCIDMTWVCNNQTDCEDGSDEVNCTDITSNSTSPACKGFVCSSDKRCISQLWVCDGNYDCDDQSDESLDTCRHHVHTPIWESCAAGEPNLPMHKMYQCTDGSCLYPDRMCDGLPDCKDSSDEGHFCHNWHTMCTNITCGVNSTCYPNRSGPECVCLESYYRYNATLAGCQPVNMCAQPRPVCAHICEQQIGSFTCRCEEGYLLDGYKVGYACLAPDPEPLLFFSTRNAIKYITVKSKNIVTIESGVKQAHGIAYDGKDVYWVETAQGHQAIVRVSLDDVTGTKHVMVGLGLEDPGDIAIDWLGGHFYFSDAERRAISACSLYTNVCTDIKTDARVPKHLTLDVRNGKMYWADWHDRPVIMQANMDGSNASVLTSDLQNFPAGLTVDSVSGRLYYADAVLKGARLDDGKTFAVSEKPQNYHHPYAVAVFENIIYWSDWVSNTIQTSEKLTGSNLGAVLTSDSAVVGLHIYHPILTKTAHNPCINHTCSHFCLLTSNNSYACACPSSLQLDAMTGKCLHDLNYRPQYVIVGSGSTLTKIQYDALSGEMSRAVFFDVGMIHAMAYDSLRDTLYIYDAKWKTINYIKMEEFHRGITGILIYMGLDDVVDMDYDYVTDTLYFVDAGHKFLEVVSLATGKRAIIHRFEQEIPISLCVLSDYGTILVAVSESEFNTIHIDLFGLDGSSRQHIRLNNLKGPHIKMRYSQKMDNVYLADEGNMVIDLMHPQGSGRETYRELSTSVMGLAVTDNLVLWTSRHGLRLYWADIHDTSRNIRRIELSQFSNKTHLHIQATVSQPSVPVHPCQHARCSDICVQTPRDTHFPGFISQSQSSIDSYAKHPDVPISRFFGPSGYKCLCPPGLLLIDGNCKELVVCQETEAYCHRTNICIFKTELCDGKKDCEHGEDEEGCEYTNSYNTCGEDQVLCEGKCVSSNQVCANTVTTTTQDPVSCTQTQVVCKEDRVCIERSQMCDGVPDCSDGSDEGQSICSTLNCLHTEFMCSSGHCILKAFKCDGEIDCSDGSDEFNCNNTCAKGFFQCRNMECVTVNKRCDAQADCIDNSDEEGCEEPEFDQEEPENCAAWEYTCELNRTICVPLTARCNENIDCPGGTDEANCGDICKNGMKCHQENLCVPHSRICDAKRDCVDGSDETPKACAAFNKTSLLYPLHVLFPGECHDGYRCVGGGPCIEWWSVCDKKVDCFDGSDEGGTCLSACNNHTCAVKCQPTPVGPVCRCPNGFRLAADQRSCDDEDECSKDVCSQRCYNTYGSFVCSCHRGYALRSDRRSCKAVKGNMSVLYVTGNSVRSITADGRIGIEFNENIVASITDMDYDVAREKLYVTSVEASMLIEVNSTRSKIVITNIGRPSKVAVEWVTGNVYFVDSATSASAHRLRVCNVRRKKCSVLQKLPADSVVSSLVIDPASRRIFYCVTRDLESVIWSSNLAGRHVAQMAVVPNCTGLAADTFKQRLYVAETGPARIVSMDYKGNLFKQVLTEDPHLQAPHDLAIFEDHIYFLVANSFKLSRCQLFGKKHCELYLQRVFNANTFMIRHKSVQRDDIPDLCQEEKCEHVCVLSDLVPMCLCADGSVSRDGSCPLIPEKDLPLFNGWSFQDYQKAHKVSVSLVIGVVVLLLVYFGGFLYYHFVYKKRRAQLIDYAPVHFQNSMVEGNEGLSPIFTPVSVQMPQAGLSSNQEFVNPLQFFKNWRPHFNWQKRPVGTAGLDIVVPPLDVSDTESDIDERSKRLQSDC